MHISGSGRFVFVAQWVLAVLLPIFFFIGRGFVGAQIGWLGFFGFVYGAFTILVLLVPPLLTLFDPVVRKAKATRTFYDIATALLWLALLVGALTVPDSGDSGQLDSALTVWTGMSQETSASIFYGAAFVLGITYAAAFVAGVVGIIRGRREYVPD